jgi:hypothetical protein
MTSTMNHTDCTHPATKAGRAKCRRDRAAQAKVIADEITSLRASYYDNTRDGEEIIAALHRIDPALTRNFYWGGDATIEEIIASL